MKKNQHPGHKKINTKNRKTYKNPSGARFLFFSIRKIIKKAQENLKYMAGLTRLELATFRVTGGRSNQLSYSPSGSLDRTRTCDLTINSRVLYQLSYQGTDLLII